ncbi:hypothetical protein HYU23_00595 [Candidatus Woesearchaeota archaeon]|nr:hypothetical protein [Candidatus Woesearchaeota archaeon]
MISNIDAVVTFMLLDESGRQVASEKQEKILEKELLLSLAKTDVNSTYKGFFRKRMEFWHETLFHQKNFAFLTRNYRLTYQIIVRPIGKVTGAKSFSLSDYWSKFKSLIPKKEQKLLSEKSEIEKPKEWIKLPGNTYEDYSYLDLLVSISRYNFNKNWNECQKLLHKNKEFMLTIRQFVDFLNLLRSGEVEYSNGEKVPKKEVERILNEIIEVRSPWRSEWLDAKFINKEEQIHIVYNKLNAEGETTEVIEPLKDCLIEDKTPGIGFNSWLNNKAKHGLPLNNIKDGSLWYWYPRANSVVWFRAGSGRVVLLCFGNPGDSGSRLGVRRAKIFRVDL